MCPLCFISGAEADRKLPVLNPGGNTENIAANFTRANTGFHHSGNVTVATSAAGNAHKPSFGSVWPNSPGMRTMSGHVMPQATASQSQQWSNSKLVGQPAASTQSLKYHQGMYKQPNPSNLHRADTATSSAFRPQSINTATSSASSVIRTTPSTNPSAVAKANILTSGCMDQAKVSQDRTSTPVCKNQMSRYVSDTTVRAGTGQTTASSARTVAISSCQSRTDPPKQSPQNSFR